MTAKASEKPSGVMICPAWPERMPDADAARCSSEVSDMPWPCIREAEHDGEHVFVDSTKADNLSHAREMETLVGQLRAAGRAFRELLHVARDELFKTLGVRRWLDSRKL